MLSEDRSSDRPRIAESLLQRIRTVWHQEEKSRTITRRCIHPAEPRVGLVGRSWECFQLWLEMIVPSGMRVSRRGLTYEYRSAKICWSGARDWYGQMQLFDLKRCNGRISYRWCILPSHSSSWQVESQFICMGFFLTWQKIPIKRIGSLWGWPIKWIPLYNFPPSIWKRCGSIWEKIKVFPY